MTVLFDDVTTIAGFADGQRIRFSVPVLRENDSGDGIITTKHHDVRPVDGTLTTPDLDAGPAKVSIGMKSYNIVIPDSPTPVRLWPLIDAGMPPPPAGTPGFVRNGGGVARVQALTQAEYDTATHDPATLYVITD